MKIKKIQQNSEEWEEFRKGKSGGSELKDLWSRALPKKEQLMSNVGAKADLNTLKKMTAKQIVEQFFTPEDIARIKLSNEPKQKYYELLADRVARPLTPNDYVDRLNGEPFSLMLRGHILEPEIARAFAKRYHKKLDDESVVWVSDDNDNMYISPDRTITSKDGKVREAVEIKALTSPNVLKIWKTQKIPEEYLPQIVQYFIVNQDLETLYWVVGTDLIPGLELQVFKIHRDDDIVKDKMVEIRATEKQLLKMLDEDTKKIAELGGF